MFLKNAKRFFVKSSSITVRLTLFYAIATFLLLVAIAFFLYWAMVSILYQNDKQFLVDKIAVVTYLLNNKDVDHSALKHEVCDVPFVLSNSIYHYSIRIMDKSDHTVLETMGMQNKFKDIDFFTKPLALAKRESQWWRANNGEKYLLMQTAVKIGSGSGSIRIIQAALDVSYQHAAISQYRKRAIMMLLMGELFAILVGYMIARRGLRRLYELIDTTKKITATSLHQRISTTSWPKELRKLGRAFNEMLDRIEIAFSHLIQFADDLAHELRTPINNLMGQTEIVLSKTSSAEEYHQVLESNFEELQRINNIIENLLFLARAENPQLHLKKTQLDLYDEIKMVCEFYQVMADDKAIQITFAGKGTLFANQVMLRRMISNLLSNALKYTMENGKIHFRIKVLTNHLVEIKLSDSGVGIPPEHVPHLFNRFYRVDPARSQHTGSIGLGLAIVKSIVDLHHGKITMTSKVGKGTIITIRLPKKLS
jgi:two-component system heavy metal sensor histidine kinase CusS